MFLPWGTKAEELGFVEYVQDKAISGPESFTVGDDETFYIYDTWNSCTLKTFRNGELINQMPIIGKADFVDRGYFKDMFRDMIFVDGSLIAYSEQKNAFYKITDNAVEKFDIPCQEGWLITLYPTLAALSDSTFLVKDYPNDFPHITDMQARRRAYDLGGSVVLEPSMESNPYACMTKRVISDDDMEMVIRYALVDSKNNAVNSVDLVVKKDSLTLPSNKKGILSEVDVYELGQDNQGYVYICISRFFLEEGKDDYFDAYQRLNFVKLNIKEEILDVGLVEAFNYRGDGRINDYGMPLYLHTVLYASWTITPEGAIYHALPQDKGISFLRYTFD